MPSEWIQFQPGMSVRYQHDAAGPMFHLGDEGFIARGYYHPYGLGSQPHLADFTSHQFLSVLDEREARMPNQPKTVARTVRVDDALWQAARDKATERGETVSDVIRRALKRYVR